jgi:hypothetical protein
MKTVKLAVPMQLLAVVEVDVPEDGDTDKDGNPLALVARFGMDTAGSIDLHAPLVRMDEGGPPFVNEAEQAHVAAFAVGAVLLQGLREHNKKRESLVQRARVDDEAQTMTWGAAKGEA